MLMKRSCMQQRDANFVPQGYSPSSVRQLPVRTALNAQSSTLLLYPHCSRVEKLLQPVLEK